MQLDIHDDADFLESDRESNPEVIMEVLKDYLYDLDDIRLVYIEVAEL
jgi:5,10-methenyltetrahydromethanopterin hydrogenase